MILSGENINELLKIRIPGGTTYSILKTDFAITGNENKYQQLEAAGKAFLENKLGSGWICWIHIFTAAESPRTGFALWIGKVEPRANWWTYN